MLKRGGTVRLQIHSKFDMVDFVQVISDRVGQLAGLDEDVKVLRGRASEFEEDPTFAPLAEMVRRELGLEEGAPLVMIDLR